MQEHTTTLEEYSQAIRGSENLARIWNDLTIQSQAENLLPIKFILTLDELRRAFEDDFTGRKEEEDQTKIDIFLEILTKNKKVHLNSRRATYLYRLADGLSLYQFHAKPKYKVLFSDTNDLATSIGVHSNVLGTIALKFLFQGCIVDGMDKFPNHCQQDATEAEYKVTKQFLRHLLRLKRLNQVEQFNYLYASIKLLIDDLRIENGYAEYTRLLEEINEMQTRRDLHCLNKIIDLLNLLHNRNQLEPKLNLDQICDIVRTKLQGQPEYFDEVLDIQQFSRTAINLTFEIHHTIDLPNSIEPTVINSDSVTNEDQIIATENLEKYKEERYFIKFCNDFMAKLCAYVVEHPWQNISHDRHHAISRLLKKTNDLLFQRERAGVIRLVELFKFAKSLDEKNKGIFHEIVSSIENELALNPRIEDHSKLEHNPTIKRLSLQYKASKMRKKQICKLRDQVPFKLVSQHLNNELRNPESTWRKLRNWFASIFTSNSLSLLVAQNGFLARNGVYCKDEINRIPARSPSLLRT